MPDLDPTILEARILRGRVYDGFVAPRISMLGDGEGAVFQHQAVLTIPKLLYLYEAPGGIDAVSHLAVHIAAPFFAEHGDWVFEISVNLDDQFLDKRLFHSWYRGHQFLIPINLCRKETQTLLITAKLTKSGSPTGDIPNFTVSTFLMSKPLQWELFEKESIWLFSTARSGSTWLMTDILCGKGKGRSVDESGVGRMFAPLQMGAERFYNPADRPFYIESGFGYETGKIPRPSGDAVAVFQRAFSNMAHENAILSHHNFDLYHRMLRDVALEHVMNEWGMLGYSKIVFKMPDDSQGADFISRAFPNSYIIFLMRDGRDVMRSRFSPFASKILAITKDVALRRHAIAYYSHLWNFQIDIIRSAFEAHREDRRVFIRYEDLRSNPIENITKIFADLQMHQTDEEIARVAEQSLLENMPASVRGPDKPRQNGLIGGFKNRFSDDEIALMNSIMGPNLERYGYL